MYATLLNKYYVDELYDYAFTGRRPLGPVRLGAMGVGEAAWKFDAAVIDGGVNGAGWMTRFWATVSGWWDKWIIDGLVNLTGLFTKAGSVVLRTLQTGFWQNYALMFVLGLFILFIWYVYPSIPTALRAFVGK